MNLPNPTNRALFVLLCLSPALCLLTAGAVSRAAAPSPSPAASATPAAMPSATPAVSSEPPRYDGVQQSQYVSTANTAFMAQRKAKFQTFVEARTAFETAGGISQKGLTSKAAVTERRDLLAKVQAANDDYLAFLATQDRTYHDELAKTPLVASDINALVAAYIASPAATRTVASQQLEKELLTRSDDMLGALDKWDGEWSVNAAGRILFKKKANLAAYTALEQKYNAVVTEIQKVQAGPTPAASPSASPAPSASPSASP